MPEIKNSTKGEAEAIMICLDTSLWMEDNESPMFMEQAEAIKLYCTKKFESHSETLVGLCAMADFNFHYIIFPTRSIGDIMAAIDFARIGGRLRLCMGASFAYSYWFGSLQTDMRKRIVFFAGGAVYDRVYHGEELGRGMKDNNVACDVISFGDPYMDKKDLFEALIRSADYYGNCNVCHVPPESSVPEALSRSQIIVPARRVGGGSRSAPPPTMPIEICVKAPPTGSDANTDCPFCQRVLLTLREKELRYKTHLIDLDNCPEWFVEANPDGLLPLIRFGDGDWVSNSDVIVDTIEINHPNPPLVTPPYFAYLGLKILPKLLAFLKNKNDDTQQALFFELMALEEHLSEYGGPYVNGEAITAVDLSLAPKLYHLVEACKGINKWNIPEDFTKVLNYNKLLFDRSSFKETEPLPGDVIAGWHKKLEVKS